jgi:hypothetical protein
LGAYKRRLCTLNAKGNKTFAYGDINDIRFLAFLQRVEV